MENNSKSEEPGVIIFGQKFCSKLEHIPIKKRILLRDSPLYQRTPPSVEDLNQKIDSPDHLSQNSVIPGSPLLDEHSDLNHFSKQQADVQLNDYCRESMAMNMENTHSHSLFSGIQTRVDVIVGNPNKDSEADAVSTCTKGELRSMSSFAPVGKGDCLIAKSSRAVLGLIDNETTDSFSGVKSAVQPDHETSKDLEAVQSIAQDNRILWDLNVEMDAWVKPDTLLNVESKPDPTTSKVQSDSNLERSEGYRLKRESAVTLIDNDTGNNVHSMVESMDSDGIYKHEQKTSDSTGGELCGSIREDQLVAASSCHDKSCSITKPSMEIESMNLSCNHELDSKMDEHVNVILGENTTNFFDCAPRRDLVNVCATPNNSVVSTAEQAEQSSDNKNGINEGEGSVDVLHISDDKANVLSKKGTDSKAGQLDVTLRSSAHQLEWSASFKESDLIATPEEKVIAETIKAAPSTRELTKTPSKHVDSDMVNPLLGSLQEGCDASIVQSVTISAMCHQGAVIVKQVPSIDKDCWSRIDHDYEDGELREIDMHCWNEDKSSIGEIECLDYEPDIEDIDDLDESQTSESVGKGESGLKSKKYKFSETLIKNHLVRVDDVKMGLNDSEHGSNAVNTQLEKKLSGWDQLPKDGRSLSEVQKTKGILSRTLRSKLHSCSDIPALYEDAEDKETVVERRRIRSKVMDDSIHAYCGSRFDKFNEKRRSTPHIHGRNRVEDWDSERRSSIKYHDLYDNDNHSGSRHTNVNSKGREHCRSRSPHDRNEAYGPSFSYSRYSNERSGSRAEGSGRGSGNGYRYRGSLGDERPESEFCARPQFARRDRSFSPRPAAHFSETVIRSRSRSRTRSPPPLWIPPYERLGPRGHRRSPEFNPDDRVKRTRLPFWKSNYPPDNEMRYNSPPPNGYLPQNKSRWNDDEDFDSRVSRDRSPVRSFSHKEKFDASHSRRSFKSSVDFRPTGYRERVRELTPPDRVRGYIAGTGRRKHEDSFEADQRKRY